jgi:hypothetical protein
MNFMNAWQFEYSRGSFFVGELMKSFKVKMFQQPMP